MAADLSLLSLAQLQKLSQQQKLSWKNNSWDVRAFEDDQASRSTAWLPRAYTCTFCRREFKSAQALGGHMNVHRRDRARLRQSSQEVEPTPTTTNINASPIAMFTSEDRSSFFYPMDGTSSFGLSTAAVRGGGSRELDLLRGDVIRESNTGGGDGMMLQEVDLELRLGWS